MSKKNRPTDSGGNWMDTYGDMVTLLLTFFIMLYSMSTAPPAAFRGQPAGPVQPVSTPPRR